MERLILDGQPLTLAEIEAVSLFSVRVTVAPDVLARVAAGWKLIEEIVATGQKVYGVNTGFGKLSDVSIPPESLAQLQRNLVRSHAGGVGQPLSAGRGAGHAAVARQCAGQRLQRLPPGAG